jgi:hypothetical protein
MKADVGTGRAESSSENAGAASAPILTLASGETVTLTPDALGELDSALRLLRRQDRLHRDLGAEIEALLTERPGLSTIEIARAIRARDQDVRLTLNGDSRFQVASPPAGRSRKVKAWILASRPRGVVPRDRTSSGRDTS